MRKDRDHTPTWLLRTAVVAAVVTALAVGLILGVAGAKPWAAYLAEGVIVAAIVAWVAPRVVRRNHRQN
jgi:hypothetical protein